MADVDSSLFHNPSIPPHSLSAKQLSVLSSFCEAIFPSLAPDGTYLADNSGHGDETSEEIDPVEYFLKFSGADNDVPNKVARLIQFRLRKEDSEKLSLVLWLLTTTIGTLALSGVKAFTLSFPFLLPFHKYDVKRREAIISSWKTSRFLPVRTIFKALRSLTGAVLFTDLDEKSGKNPLWSAIKYSGPDLNSKRLLDGHKEGRSLRNSVIHLPSLGGDIVKDLIEAGVSVIDQPQLTEGLVKRSKFSDGEPVVVRCDAVVIGSGCGGPVVASRLAEAGLTNILILEKGEYFDRSELSQLEGPTFHSMFDNGGIMSSEDGSLTILAGSTVGGGSRINWAASFRTPGHVRQEWATKFDLKRYEGEEYEAAMDAVCARLSVHDKVEHNFYNSVLVEGSQKLGYPVCPIPHNAPGPHNCNYCGMGCRNGEKQSTADTWLLDVAAKGAKILTGCEADRVLYRKKEAGKGGSRRKLEASGVLATFSHGWQKKTLIIESPVVVVAAGSIHTPAVLLRSGLSNKNIGATLRVHPVSGVWGYMPDGPPGKSTEGGIMTACCTVAANWDTSGYGSLLQTPWVHPGLVASLLPWTRGDQFKEMCLRSSRVAIIIAIARDIGWGTVTLDSQGKPLVRYSLCKEDESHILDGLSHGLRILNASGAKELGTLNTRMGFFDAQVDSSGAGFEAYLKQFKDLGVEKNSFGLYTAHQTGSCPMGTNPLSSVVDPEGESWEVENLFIGDGSVFPTPVGVNPMISIQSVAYCIGQGIVRILEERSVFNRH